MDRTKISKNLIALRGEKSREEVAFSIGISASALSMYETGQRIPRDEIKLKLAEYYGVDVQSIFLSNRYTKCELCRRDNKWKTTKQFATHFAQLSG